MKSFVTVWMVAVFSLGGTFSASAAEKRLPKTERLLRLSGVSVATTESQNLPSFLKTLTDDSAATFISLRARQRDIELTFSFGGKIVSPSRLELTFTGTPGDASVQVAVLVSDEKQGTQFRFVGTELVHLKRLKHRLALPSFSGRRVLIRFALDKTTRQLNLADIRLLGIQGELASSYLFKESPANALQVLDELKSLSTHDLTADELSLAADAQDGQLDKWSVAEASLVASGVTNRERRRRYLSRIAAWEQEARGILAKEKTSFDKGQRLLQWLHRKAMKKGYVSKQTRVSTLVDEGTYNCVSSAMLYAILGRRLNMDVRGIEVPDHAFGILYAGKRHADVETTNRSGFNPARDPKARRAFEGQTGLRYIPERHADKRREVNAAGLVAMIYYNRGVGHVKARQFHRALNCNFMALSLDRHSASAVKNALTAIGNWTYDLTKSGDYEKAISVSRVGLKLAPGDKLLRRNHLAAWSQWATKTINKGNHEQALVLLDRALAATKSPQFEKLKPWVFIRHCRKLSKAGKWDDAEALVDRGIESLDGESERKLRDFQRLMLLARSSNEIEQKRFAAAAAAMGRFRKFFPSDSRIDTAAGFLTQEWAEQKRRESGFAAGVAGIERMLELFPRQAKVRRAAKSYLGREVDRLSRKQRFDEAWKLVEQQQTLFASPAAQRRMLLSIVADEVRFLRAAGNHSGVIGVYERALEKLGSDTNLQRGLVAAWDELAQQAMTRKEYQQAIEIYADARRRIPGEPKFDRNLPFIAQEWAGQLAAQNGPPAAEDRLRDLIKQFPEVTGIRNVAKRHVGICVHSLLKKRRGEEALKVLSRSGDLMADTSAVDNMVRGVFDQLAETHAGKGDFQQAVSVYARGMQRFPKNAGLKKNARAAWDAWARKRIAEKKWPAAAEIYRQALGQFPNDRLFTNNLRYCEGKIRQQQSTSDVQQ